MIPVVEDITEVLTPAELERLTLWKLRYTLEALDFTDAEVRALMFEAWRWRTDRNRG